MARLLAMARKHKTDALVTLGYGAVSGGAVGSALIICRVLSASYGIR